MKLYSRLGVIGLAVLLMISMAACAPQTSQQTQDSTTQAQSQTQAQTTAAATTAAAAAEGNDGDAGGAYAHNSGGVWFDEPLKFTWLYDDNSGFSLKEDWLPIVEVKKRTNVDLEFIVTPSADYDTKKKLLLNSAEWPDVFMQWGLETEYSMNGILCPIEDHVDKMPYLKAILATGEYDADLINMRESDGKFYPMPRFYPWPGYDAGIITRVDYLKDHGLEIPKDYNEVYELMRYFKEQNPDSWPMSAWEMGWPITFMRPSWGIEEANHQALYYDTETKLYAPAYTSLKMKSLLEWWAKGYKEGLVDPEIFTKGWDPMMEMLVTERALFAFCWGDNTDATNSLARDTLPNFTLEHIVPPASTEGDKPKWHLAKMNGGLGVPSAIVSRSYFDDMLMFFDWFLYSDEGSELTNWGVEGITFNWKDGKRVFSDELLASPDGPAKQAQIDYGLFGRLQNIWMPDRYWEYAGAVCVAVTNEMMAQGQIQPARPLPKLTVDDIDDIGLLSAPINDAFLIARDDFISGRRSLDTDWDQFVADMESRGINEMAKIYNDKLPN